MCRDSAISDCNESGRLARQVRAYVPAESSLDTRGSVPLQTFSDASHTRSWLIV